MSAANRRKRETSDARNQRTQDAPASEQNVSRTFHSFSRLPPELRAKVWRYALPPSDLGLMLYEYKPDHRDLMLYYLSRLAAEARNNNDVATNITHETDEDANCDHWIVKFRKDCIYCLHFEQADLAFVNREARSLILAWTRNQYCFIRSRKPPRRSVLCRPFIPTRDILLVGALDWSDCMCEIEIRRSVAQRLGTPSDIRHIAIHGDYKLWCQRSHWYNNLFCFCRDIKILYVVFAPSGFTLSRHDTRRESRHVRYRRWQVGPQLADACVWDPDSRRFASRTESDTSSLHRPSLSKRLLEFSEFLIESLVQYSIKAFEIRAVAAVALMDRPADMSANGSKYYSEGWFEEDG
ncbi:hypothetical protein K461DRAFT_297926 [Myriangium duriaei CBS 260.36]|uniref:2EXR domain-containing protein n=1 Tax=Myriangium duriaei CBS 260.36 TaxID=1168546 RepID=A0A9P4MCA2_9PEZI|nr:hypothetical protein K461DRAFT_297926 [Myriangium duriaei CBS 260.36]